MLVMKPRIRSSECSTEFPRPTLVLWLAGAAGVYLLQSILVGDFTFALRGKTHWRRPDSTFAECQRRNFAIRLIVSGTAT